MNRQVKVEGMNDQVAFSNKVMTRIGLKRLREFECRGDLKSSKKQKRIEEMKVEKTRKEEINGEEEKDTELGEKIISHRPEKDFLRKKETAGIVSTEGKIESKGVWWSKYTVMKRRTGSLVDLAERKGGFFKQEQVKGLEEQSQSSPKLKNKAGQSQEVRVLS